ncbi:MAG: response regulator [Treponema sp.]|nr:response regulator [Treponema sp.]
MALVFITVLFFKNLKEKMRLENLVKERDNKLARDAGKREEQEEAALASSQTKSYFLSNMSNEIRSPMNAILGVTEIIMHSEKLPAEIEEGLEKIYSSCDSLLYIINDILEFLKMETGKIDIVPANYKTADMINDLVRLNMMRVESKPIDFVLYVDKNVPVNLYGDELRIKQILSSLISNACKFTESGKIFLSVQTDAKSAAKDNETVLLLSVYDCGYNITNDKIREMFDEQGFNDQGINFEGTDLGFAVTLKLVSLMNGQIRATNERGRGSLFGVKLPQGIANNEALGREAAENLMQLRANMKKMKRSQITRESMPYGSVLIVDDVDTNIYAVSGLMNLYNLKVDTAKSGPEAIQKIKEGAVYDVIFMDHMMPEMDGMEAVKQIRGLNYKAPIVALTGNTDGRLADVFLLNGFDDIISKPIDTCLLDYVLNKLIKDKHSSAEIEESKKAEITGSVGQLQLDYLLAGSFIKDTSNVINWLEEALKKDDFDNDRTLRKLSVTIHGVKSSLLNIEERKLADLALKLETCGRERHEQDIKFIREKMPDFLNQLRALLEKKTLQRCA